MKREKVELENRNVSAARKAKCIKKHENRCAYPECETETDLAVDHIIPLWMGGKNADYNLEPLCIPHHAAKTKREAALRGKVKRLAGETGQNRQKKQIPSRPFQKGKKQQWPKRSFGKARETSSRKPPHGTD